MIGLETYSSKPAFRKRSRSPCIACAVSATTGSLRNFSSARRCPRTARPSMPGRETSSRTRSGILFFRPSSAAGPVSYSVISYRSLRNAWRSRRLSALSSTTAMVFMPVQKCITAAALSSAIPGRVAGHSLDLPEADAVAAAVLGVVERLVGGRDEGLGRRRLVRNPGRDAQAHRGVGGGLGGGVFEAERRDRAPHGFRD